MAKFAKGNPGGPGRPKKDPAPADPEIDESLPAKLGEARAAMEWTYEAGLPKHAGIRLFVSWLRRSPKEFYAELTRLEREFAEAGKSVPSGAGGEVAAAEERVEDAAGERVVAELEAWLKRKQSDAELRARAIVSR